MVHPCHRTFRGQFSAEASAALQERCPARSIPATDLEHVKPLPAMVQNPQHISMGSSCRLELHKEQICTPASAGLQFPPPALQLCPTFSLPAPNATQEPRSSLQPLSHLRWPSSRLSRAYFQGAHTNCKARFVLGASDGIRSASSRESACLQQRATLEGGFAHSKQAARALKP